MVLKIIVSLPLTFLIASCASKPVPSDLSQFSSGHFEAKALIRDLKKNKSHVINLQVNAVQPDKLRVDATSVIGTHIFSLVTDKDKVEYLVVPEKTYFVGKSSAGALKPILPIAISPDHLMNMFFEKPIQEKNWTCSKSAEGILQSCRQRRSKVRVEWSRQKGGQRLIEVSVPSVAMVQMSVRSFDDEVNVKKHPFSLRVPQSFKTVRLK